MRDIVMLILAGGALILSLLSFQQVSELSEEVYRLSAQVNQEAVQRNKVLTLGQQLENLARSFTGTTRKGAPPTR